jgi:TnpA family transposase
MDTEAWMGRGESRRRCGERSRQLPLTASGLIDAQHRQPLAAHWGSGTTLSSDVQFFHAGARCEVGGLVNLHYGQDPGVKFYTHRSDQFGPFHTKVIGSCSLWLRPSETGPVDDSAGRIALFLVGILY